MENKGIPTKILTIVGIAFVWLPISIPSPSQPAMKK
jgi:hypothetical protein